jgi:hypothetical protein
MPNQWITLAIAVLGVLHGPLGARLLKWLRGRSQKPKT